MSDDNYLKALTPWKHQNEQYEQNKGLGSLTGFFGPVKQNTCSLTSFFFICKPMFFRYAKISSPNVMKGFVSAFDG